MNLRHSYAIFLRQLYLFNGNSSRWIVIFFWSTADLLIWGLVTKYLNSVGGDQFNFLTVFIGAVVFMHFIGRAQGGISIAQLEDVWARNMINFFSTPLKVGEYILGLIITAVFTAAIAFLGMTLVAWLLFHYSIFQFGFLLLPYLLILFLFGIALGMLSISIVLRFGPAAETFAWMLPTALAPFSGVFYPISVLPEPLQWFARVIPSSYVFEGMRSAVFLGTFSANALIVGLLLSVLYFFISYFILFYYFREASKRGLFTRFLTDAW